MRRGRRALLAATAAVLALAAALPAAAVTKIEGEYQLMLDMRKTQRDYPWDWDSNNNDNWTGAELRIFSQPRTNIEAFLKIIADWKSGQPRNDTPRPVFQYREAHLRLRWDWVGRGLDSYLFSRQNRFWVENYLIKIVENDGGKPILNDREGPNAQGVRLDTWGFLGLNTTWIYSDFTDQYVGVAPTTYDATDDAFVLRARREFLRRKLRLGTTYTRRMENELGERSFPPGDRATDVLGFDARYTFKNTDYSLEWARSWSPLGEESIAFPDELDKTALSDRSVLVGEIRTLTFGKPWLGYFNFAPTGWLRGPLWDNRLGDSNRDERGFFLNNWYLLPDRAITWTSNYLWYEKRATEKRVESEIYNELYIEFVNGFTGKVYYKLRDIRRNIGPAETLEEHDDLFGELQVESRLAKMVAQAKLKDLGQPYYKQLYALQTTVNLTSQVKLYNRFAFGNDSNRLRKGIFSQIQYRPSDNVEMYLEYGPGWIGDDAVPVNDYDLEGGGDQTDILKFILKGRF